MASTGRAIAPEQGNFWRSSGRAGFDIVPTMPIRLRSALRTMFNRATPRGTPFQCTPPRHEAGRRSAIGVVAVLQSSLSRPRRWCDAGTPKADQKAGAPGSQDRCGLADVEIQPSLSARVCRVT